MLCAGFQSMSKRVFLSLLTALEYSVSIVIVVVDWEASIVLHNQVQFVKCSSATTLQGIRDNRGPQSRLDVFRCLGTQENSQELLADSRDFFDMVDCKLLPATGLLPEQLADEEGVEVSD